MNCRINDEFEYKDIKKITEREQKLIKQYRKLCDESKLTIDILIQRLSIREKGGERVD